MTPSAGAAFLDLFCLRRDDFTLQTADGRYVRAGRPVTIEDADAHLSGDITLAPYVNRGDEVLYGVLDADYAGGLGDLMRASFRLSTMGIAPALELSSRQGHLWVLCSAPARAVDFRRLLIGLCHDVHIPLKTGTSEGMEIKPTHDLVEEGRFGGGMRAPMGIQRKTGRRYPIVNPKTLRPWWPESDPVAELAFWIQLASNTPGQIAAAAHEFPPHVSPPAARRAWSGTPLDTSVIDIVAWAEQLTTLRPRGRMLVGLCPFHQERTPSFTVWPAQGRAYCFGCEWRGDGADLKAAVTGRPLADILREVRAGA